MDLSKLTDDEIELLERLLSKAAGEIVGDVPSFRIERVFVDGNTNEIDAAEPTAGVPS
jgi:hypothetical protein